MGQGRASVPRPGTKPRGTVRASPTRPPLGDGSVSRAAPMDTRADYYLITILTIVIDSKSVTLRSTEPAAVSVARSRGATRRGVLKHSGWLRFLVRMGCVAVAVG